MAETRVAIVTGSTKGIGFDTARKLAERGYRVIVTGRSQGTADEAANRIGTLVPGAAALAMAVDLGDFASVRRFAETFRAQGLPLHLLVNNAGTMVADEQRRVTAGGIEATLAANALGPFLLTHLLLDRLRASAPARIVNVSSRAHLPKSGLGAEVDWDWNDPNGEKCWEPMRFYKNSKLAVLWFTYELARRLEGSGVTVNAVCPGWVPSTLAESARGVRRFFMKYVARLLPSARTLDQASTNTLVAATASPYGERSGVFLGEEKEVRSSEQSYDVVQAKRFYDWAAERTGAGV